MDRAGNERISYRKSWGANFIGSDSVCFRVWAPAEHDVLLELDRQHLPMTAMGDGWFERTVRPVGVGQSYCFRLSDGTRIADPASSAQESSVDGRSLVIDPTTYPFRATAWKGVPWEEAVLCELHIGTFTPEGTFLGAIERLPHLGSLGINMIEIMPVAHFAGDRGWGYDGVLPYAPHPAYGTPDDLRALVDAAHLQGIAVLLDVVYNHFGPVGNPLARLTPEFFRKDKATAWGASIAFEQPAVRRFFIENALYWLGAFRFDGLRFDAVDQIEDAGPRHVLEEMAEEIRATFPDRDLHLVVEDPANRRSLLARAADGSPRSYTAAWNDDWHHAVHVLATGETAGYYHPFAEAPTRHLCEAAATGYASLAEKPHAEPGELPPQVRVNFLQNHDQTGNRAFGERLVSLTGSGLSQVLTAMLLLSPQIPLLFMGEEYGETQPFYFFADLGGELAAAIRIGRAREAENFGGLPLGAELSQLPDPGAPTTFRRSKLDWSRTETAAGRAWMAFHRKLIVLRRQHIVGLLREAGTGQATIHTADDGVVAVNWPFPSATLELRANLMSSERTCPPCSGEILFELGTGSRASAMLPGPAIRVALAR